MKKILILFFIPLILLFNKPQVKKEQKEVKSHSELPPTLHLTVVALGPLKGIISNVLWLQADEKQQEKEFYETMQYCRWISMIQPQQEDIWRYIGWNISYNVAGNYSDLNEKWSWIQKGIALMRDEGLRYNPDSEIIGYEIAQTYDFKLGFTGSTPEGQFYQKKLYDEMSQYFGDSSATFFNNLYQSSKTKTELLSKKSVRALLKNDSKIFSKKISLQQAKSSGLSDIYYYQKRNKIETELNMSVERIKLINSEISGLDWRLFHPHALYFICPKGLQEKMPQTGLAAMRSKSLVVDAFLKGKIISLGENQLKTGVNEKIFDSLNIVLEQYRKEDTYKIISTLEALIPVIYNTKGSFEAQLLYQEYSRRHTKWYANISHKSKPKSWKELIKDSKPVGHGVLLP